MGKFHDLFIRDGRARISIIILLIVVVVALILVYFFYFQEKIGVTRELPPHAKNRLIVKFKEEVEPSLKEEDTIQGADVGVATVTKINEKEKVKEVKKLAPETSETGVKGKTTQMEGIDLIYRVEFEGDKNIAKMIDEYSDDPNVEYAEPDIEVTTQLEPNDPYYWRSGSWGQSYPDLWGIKKIDSAYAWDIETGSRNVTVAVIDTGIDYNQQDLSGNIWTNSDEIPNNGADDDHNGYVDDYYGYDFYNYDSNPFDDHAHGTHCAGTIGAVGNNNKGVVGVNWQVKLMAVKFLSAWGSGYISDSILAINYAVNNGADVLSNSWGGWGRYQSLQNAINYAHNNGVLFVAAAGNSNSDCYNYSPAGLNNVVTVAATDYRDQKASFSSYGNSVEIAAPGVDILSLKSSGGSCNTVGGKYCRMSGTSMATPHTAGLAALILSKDSELTPDQVLELIEVGADDLGNPGKDIYFGYGRINSFNSLTTNITHVDGTLIKARNSSTIYLLDNGQKRPFTSAAVYRSWFDWDDYISVTSSEVSSYSKGSPVTFKPGAIVRGDNSATVYIIGGSNRHPVTSASVFLGLGYKWSNVRVVPAKEINKYTPGDSISGTGSYIDGTLIKASNSATVYLLDNGQRRPIPNREVFVSQFRWKDIVVVGSSVAALYPPGERVGFRPGVLVKSRYNPSVYVITDSEKRGITSARVFRMFGYSWNKIILTTSRELANYTTGEPLGL